MNAVANELALVTFIVCRKNTNHDKADCFICFPLQRLATHGALIRGSGLSVLRFDAP